MDNRAPVAPVAQTPVESFPNGDSPQLTRGCICPSCCNLRESLKLLDQKVMDFMLRGEAEKRHV